MCARIRRGEKLFVRSDKGAALVRTFENVQRTHTQRHDRQSNVFLAAYASREERKTGPSLDR